MKIAFRLLAGSTQISLGKSVSSRLSGLALITVYAGLLTVIGLPMRADTLVSTTVFNATGQNQTYTVPAGTDYVVIKAWGAGGGATSWASGGCGALVSARYEVSAAEQFVVAVGKGGSPGNTNGSPASGGWPGGGAVSSSYSSGGGAGGGGYTRVVTPRGAVWAGGGGGGGVVNAGYYGPQDGGAGGTPSGSAGNSQAGYLYWAGSGGTAQGGGSGGCSGTTTPGVSSGVTGGYAQGGTGSSCGGGGGGGGYYGGGGGGSFFVNGVTANGGGGGGGGASYVSGAATNISYQTGGTSDGSVVILAYQYSNPATPIISGSLIVNSQPNQPVDYWITAQNHPTLYGATNYPPGVTLNTATGEITGSPTTAGIYSSTISATNVTGTGQATMVWTIDNTPPSTPTTLAVQSGTLGESSFVLTWAAATDSGSGMGSYEVQRDGISLGVTVGTSLTVAGLSANTSYAMSVRACDLVGNWSAWSTPTLTVTTLADPNAPSVPAGVTANNLTAISVVLGWALSSDDVGVTTYQVRRNGVPIGTTSVPSMAVSGLSPITTYSFGVRAGDAAGNWSEWSDVSPNSPLTITTAASGADVLVGNALFTFNDRAAQNYTVPAGASYVVIKAWGAGGGGSKRDTSSQVGGNGGFATATFNVVPGDQFSVAVATGGSGVTTTTAGGVNSIGNAEGGWIGGGTGFSISWVSTGAGGGGGYSSVATPYGKLWAGGGGGGATSGTGGAGGGGSGTGLYAGGGATTTTGGVAASGGGGINGSAGLGANTNNFGAGGGGGYFGGASGGSSAGGNSGYSGGGGGSSYASGSAYNVIYQMGGSLPGGTSDSTYPNSNVGFGGFVGGASRNGGSGAVVILAYQTPGTNLTQTFVPAGGSQTFTLPAGADSVIAKAWGAGAGGGSTEGAGADFVTATYNVSGSQTIAVNAGAGGASGTAGGSTVVNLPGGTTLTAAGGASGVTSSIATGSQSPTSSQILAASGATPPSTTDTNYPGNNVGYGGAANGPGGNGAVVLIVHIVPPVIGGSLSQTFVQGQSVTYTISASNGPTSYSANGLPPGLTFNAATGAITGTATTSGNYASTITASNRGGSTQANLVWAIAADTTAPGTPTGLQSANITMNSFVLSWTAATDDVGVTGYEVFRDSTSLGMTTNPSFTVTGLLPLTNYNMTVRARDAAGNWSGLSAVKVVQTANIPINPTSANRTVFGYQNYWQGYSVPSNTDYIVVKIWGAGGRAGTSGGTKGGAGAFVQATYKVTPGQNIGILIGQAGAVRWPYSYGGEMSVVRIYGKASLYAGGGGNGGTAPGGDGGGGGAPNGLGGGGGYGNSGGGGGGIAGSGSSTAGVGGGGGSGNGYTQNYDDDGNPTDTNSVGNGASGGAVPAGDNWSSVMQSGGQPGSGGDNGVYTGGGGGNGLGGGGGGGSGDSGGAGGGGGGGSSGLVYSVGPVASSMLYDSTSLAPNASDPDYPGTNVGYGGLNGGYGGNGAVVIIAYPAQPVITSSLAQSLIQNKAVSYAIVATSGPTSYAASSLPAGLSLDPATGLITGSVAAPGTYTSTIAATNSSGSGSATLVWTVAADTTAPTVPTGLQAGSATFASFALSWTASTDNAAVTAYEVRKDGISIGTSATAQFTVGNLTSGTTYAMSVRAGDAAGNWSAWSTVLNVTLTPNNSGSSAQLSYADRSPTTVTLMWSPAAGTNLTYSVFRNGQLIGTTGDTAYFDSGLTAGTAYSYAIAVTDASGNVTPWSVTLSVTTTQDFSTDNDHDGIPNSVETLLNTNPNVAATPDSTNQLQVNVQRPPK